MKLSYCVIPLTLALAACSGTHQKTMHHQDRHAHEDRQEMREMMRERHFAMLDRNSDGEISRQEFMQFHADHFQAMDEDGDGRLKPEDLKPPRR